MKTMQWEEASILPLFKERNSKSLYFFFAKETWPLNNEMTLEYFIRSKKTQETKTMKGKPSNLEYGHCWRHRGRGSTKKWLVLKRTRSLCGNETTVSGGLTETTRPDATTSFSGKSTTRFSPDSSWRLCRFRPRFSHSGTGLWKEGATRRPPLLGCHGDGSLFQAAI